MGIIHQVHAQSRSSANQLYMVAGIGAILSALFMLVTLFFTDWENPAATNPTITILGVLGYIALLPALYALYRHLSLASQGPSAIAALAGVLSLAGVSLGTVTGFDTDLGMVGGIFASFGMFVWLGLTGYTALNHRLLPQAWAIFTIALGVLAVTAGIISMTTGSESAASEIGWAVFSVLVIAWSLWTGIEFIQRARTATIEA